MNVDQKAFEDVKVISNEIAPFYQAQNDFYDCFGDQNEWNKSAQDIENGKCTWCAMMAMELGNDQQKDVMRKYYGDFGKMEIKICILNLLIILKFLLSLNRH